MRPLLIAAATLQFTISAFEADPDDCHREGVTLERVAAIRIFSAVRYGNGMPQFVRERPAQVGSDTVNVVDDPPGYTYWVAPVDSAGNVACLGDGYTVGIPTVGVEPRFPASDRGYFIDVRSRRTRELPKIPGIYWYREPGKPTRKIRVLPGGQVQ